MLFAEHGQLPRVQHVSLVDAKIEAERIGRANAAKGIDSDVYVLEAISFCRTSEIPVIWEMV